MEIEITNWYFISEEDIKSHYVSVAFVECTEKKNTLT